MASQRLPALLAVAITPSGTAQEEHAEIRDLIRRMSLANPLWGAPRIHGELLKLGSKSAKPRSADTCRGGPKSPPRPGESFLHNHLTDIPRSAAADPTPNIF